MTDLSDTPEGYDPSQFGLVGVRPVRDKKGHRFLCSIRMDDRLIEVTVSAAVLMSYTKFQAAVLEQTGILFADGRVEGWELGYEKQHLPWRWIVGEKMAGVAEKPAESA